MDEDGRGYCPGDAHPEDHACEDCRDLERCEMCGLWFPARTLVDRDLCLMCPECLEADGPDEEPLLPLTIPPREQSGPMCSENGILGYSNEEIERMTPDAYYSHIA